MRTRSDGHQSLCQSVQRSGPRTNSLKSVRRLGLFAEPGRWLGSFPEGGFGRSRKPSDSSVRLLYDGVGTLQVQGPLRRQHVIMNPRSLRNLTKKCRVIHLFKSSLLLFAAQRYEIGKSSQGHPRRGLQEVFWTGVCRPPLRDILPILRSTSLDERKSGKSYPPL